MRQKRSIAELTLLAAIAVAIPHAKAAPAADLLVINGKIVTMDKSHPRVQAMAVKDGKIIFTGTTNRAKKWRGKHTTVYDAAGRLILPGLHDTHIHLAESAQESLQLALYKAKDKRDILDKLRSYWLAHQDAKEIAGNGLPLPALMSKEQTSPSSSPAAHSTTGGLDRHDLDSVVSTIPVVLHSEDWHTAWLNSRAVELIKASTIDSLLADPAARDMLERLPDGSYSGVVREQALKVIDDVLAGPPLPLRVAALKQAVKTANSFGITSIQDAHATAPVTATYAELARQHGLNLRVALALHTDSSDPHSQVESLKKQRAAINDKFDPATLKVVAAKIFVDGVIETGTAALLEPYTGKSSSDPRALGQPTLAQPALNALVASLVAEHFNVHMHAIGDRAVRMGLNSLDLARPTSASSGQRHQIAHLELVDKADIARFKALDVTANWQSYWAFRDPYIEELTIPQLGPVRASRLYPMREIADSGARMAAGSDWSVSTMDPLSAIQVAVTRQSLNPDGKPPLGKEQALTLDQILAAYTTGGAWVNHSEALTGSLSQGKMADFIVLDRDFLTGPASSIHRARVIRTYLSGRLIYRRH